MKSKNEKILNMFNSGQFRYRQPPPPFYIILSNSLIKWDVIICIVTVWNLAIIPIDFEWNVECFTNDQGTTTKSFTQYHQYFFK